MSYKSATIAEVLGKLNKHCFLPAIQRPFVWEPEQIIRLFDSLMQGYPISSFLFWDLQGANRENWEVYRFIQDFQFGEVHDEKLAPGGDDITLVLDGQQRLTSLYIGLLGTYTVRMKNQRKNNPRAWVRQALFLDLLKDPKPNDEDSEDYFEDIGYGFKFFSQEALPRNSGAHHWFRVSDILGCRDSDLFDDLKEQVLDQAGPLQPEQTRLFRRNLDRLYRVAWLDETIAYYTETSQSYDKVLDIFIRANDGGTKLSKSDLLMSMVTLKWSGLNARDEINDFVTHINARLTSENSVDRDFVLRAGLVLSELDYGFKVENFTRDNLSRIESNWLLIKQAVVWAFRTLNRFGIDAHNLTSLNAAMPIAYYFFRNAQGEASLAALEHPGNLERIRRWVASALLNGVFGGQANVTIGMSRNILREAATHSRLFPASTLVTRMTNRGRNSLFDEDAVNKVLQMDYRKTLGFVALSLLYDDTDWETRQTQKDHIFPVELFTADKLLSADLPEPQIERALGARDRIPNLLLLSPDEYIEKGGMPFIEWALTRDEAFLERHLLPTDREFYAPHNFIAFLDVREMLIAERLGTLFDFDDRDTAVLAAVGGTVN